MKAIRNIYEAKNEVTRSFMKSVLKKLFSEIVEVHCNYENDIQNIIEEISRIAISGGIEDVDEDDIQTVKITQRTLQEMDCHTYLGNDVSEPVPVRNLTVSRHNQCMELLEKNNEDYEGVSVVKRGWNGLLEAK